MKIEHLNLWAIITLLCSALTCHAYDFEIKGLYYNKLSNTTVECCGGGQSPYDTTYRQKEITIPSKIRYGSTDYTVVKIADGAWSNCKYYVFIETLNLPETIVEIGKLALRDCTNLKNINFPEGLEYIGDGAFQGPEIEDYVFPKSLKFLGDRVFNRYLRNVIFTSDVPPIINIETFVYQNGYQYDVFIPDDFAIYVPNVDKYSSFRDYLDYLNPICFLPNNEHIYSGLTPNINYINNLPKNHTIEFDTKDLPINVGVYDLNISGILDGKFIIEYPIHLCINKADLNIKIHNKSREYGNENPEFTADISGIQNNENIYDIIAGYRLFSNASKTSDIGEYLITIPTHNAQNYNIILESGKLLINKAPLSISIGEYSREYGIANNKFSLFYNGLKNNENSPKWDKVPEFITDANLTSHVGTYSISVNCQPHNYEIIENRPGVLTITKAPLTLKVTNQERPYFQDNSPFDYSLVGLRNNDDKTCISSQPVFQCNANKNSDCGKYDIIASGANANNYELTFEKGILTINPISLTLRASNISREYGEPNPVLRFEAIGLAEIDDIDNALQEFPTLSTNAVGTSNAGEYAILMKGGKAKNYTISLRDGILTINKAPLSVIAENAERVYGENNPTFTRSYLGFKLSDSETTAFSSLPRLTCSATKYSDVGEYPIVVEGGTARNYEINNYENGILTINQAALILRANDKSRLYYESNPQFDFTLIGLKNSDSKSCITIPPSYECSAELNSNVGLYQIVPKEATAKNYSIEYQNGNLTINQRTLTASVGNYTRKYNTDNPAFEVFYDGFVNNEDQSILTQSSAASCSATKTSDVGTYTISVSGGDAINYVITKYNNGVLTIEKAYQSIVWDQDLSNVELYSQIALNATSSANLPITYEMAPNNVATLYDNGGVWYLDCYGSGAVNVRAVQNGDKNYNSASVIYKTLVVNGGDNYPSNPQIYLHVETAGSLSSLIADSKKNQIKNLRLSGYLNGTDINYIREMAGCDSYGNSTTGILETLDISQCTIVSGGRSYYLSNQTTNYEIGNYMFYNCNMLVNLMLPDNTTIIRSYAFADCRRLSIISIPNSVTSFGANTFQNDISLLRIPMPTELTSIGDKAFYGCNGLSELTITHNVRSIGNRILDGCENITKVNVEGGNKYFISKDGVLYTYSSDELLIYPVNYSTTEYVVPEGVSKIAPYAFNNAKKLTDVVLPSSLTSVGANAFIGCVNINSIHIRALNPPVCQNDCFEQVSKTRCELRVPKGCYSYYWVAPVWSEFNHIVEMEYNSIVDIISDGIEIISQNEVINIHNIPSGQSVRVYQTNGTLIYNVISDGNPIQYQCASKGTIIIVVGNNKYKLFIK